VFAIDQLVTSIPHNKTSVWALKELSARCDVYSSLGDCCVR